MSWTRPAGAALAGIAIACTLDTSIASCSTSTSCLTPPPITSQLLASIAIVVLGLTGVGSIIAIGRALGATGAAGRALANLAIPPPPALFQVTRPLSLPPVLCLVSDLPSALCAGGLHPTIYLSTGLLNQLSGDEIRAVLIHEASHARRRDPVRRMLRRSLASTLFFIPVLRTWTARAAIQDEIRADRDVIHSCGPEPLARALLLTAPVPTRAAAALDGAASLRVAHLLGGPVRLPVPRVREWVLSAAGAIAAVTAVLCLATAAV